ncbi:hypothetical protein [Corynebacterium lowii]|uniref:Uncharacterized protein n=1 Tax=Corynebacterium lowii TaxID=1544413 RepID=A0A0N8VZI0_9CORY|nr:hypothetical protein [Corynebacterium lowii]KQB83954.1 hypothetical protein Clow_02155 [Corynebacterium lowii]MDP9852797.1 hypothetical protein [Corynebacterium lowii]
MRFPKQPKITAAALGVTLLGLSAPAAHAFENTTPDVLPYRAIAEVEEEAQRSNLSDEETVMAVDLQQMVNAYHSFPAELKTKPLSDPEVKRRLASAVEEAPAPGTHLRRMEPSPGTDCVLSLAEPSPDRNIWAFTSAAGGVVPTAILITETAQTDYDLATEACQALSR